MGMAASQARYLALVARKSNCEYEGQQINQARLALANQSANLFNQMLGLNVPVPPSTQDFTKNQYSFTDGINAAVIDSWSQLAEPDSDGYNYVVDYHYNASVYTGSQTKKTDPQVQFSNYSFVIGDYDTQVALIQSKLEEISELNQTYEAAKTAYLNKLKESKNIGTFRDVNTYNNIQSYSKEGDNYIIVRSVPETYVDENTGITYTTYTVQEGDTTIDLYSEDGTTFYTDYGVTQWTGEGTPTVKNIIEYREFVPFKNLTDEQKASISESIERFKSFDSTISEENIYCYVGDNGDIQLTLKSDIENLIQPGGTGSLTYLPIYHTGTEGLPEERSWISLGEIQQQLDDLNNAQVAAKQALDNAQNEYNALCVPSYVGNNKLTPLMELTDAQMADITQIIADMTAQDINTNLSKYFDPDTKEYNGGIYMFTDTNGITYYVAYDDLANSVLSADSINSIDDQDPLAIYRASYVTTKITQQKKAILETDENGRFVSVRFGDDTMKYKLNVETITDDVAYEDAMNKYYYENAKYDKMIQDINAKTEIIQQEDRTLELRLKQLDTEQNALSTEIDAVAKVVKENVEKSFKTFGG